MNKYDQEKMIKLYSSGLSLEEVANKIGCNHTWVYKIIKRNGISRSKTEAAKISKKLKQWNDSRKLFNENVFNTVSYKEAYFLGLFFADGCICSTTNGRNVITITSQDKSMIDNCSDFFCSKNKINKKDRKDPDNTYYTLSICSKHLFNKLIFLGCMEKKSLIIGAPNIEEKYYSSFLLGLFDGDGCISLHKKNNSWKAAIATASLEMSVFISDFLKKYYIIHHVNISNRENSNLYQVAACGVSAKYFLSILYKNIDYNVKPLDRKYKKYKTLENCHLRKGPHFQQWEKEIINKMPDNEVAAKTINSDFRNYGWKRSKDTIRHFRRKCFKNI